MKVSKITEGTMVTLDKVFGKGAEVEVTQDEFDYLNSTFPDTFILTEDTQVPEGTQEDTQEPVAPKGKPKNK